MPVVCTFSGSYYDQSPWTEYPCAADSVVPAGCPVHFVSAAQVMPSDVTAEKVASDYSTTPIASTTTVVGTDTQGFVLPDEFSCDCAPTNVSINFQRFEVAVPMAKAGDAIVVRFPGGGQTVGFEFGAAGPCPTPDWPTEYDVALACDRCPMDPNSDPHGDPPLGIHGCSTGGDASLFALSALALLPLARRYATARSRRTRTS